MQHKPVGCSMLKLDSKVLEENRMKKYILRARGKIWNCRIKEDAEAKSRTEDMYKAYNAGK